MKPDRYERGHIYMFNLPEQPVSELTGGKWINRAGLEQHAPHPCLVISVNDFNDSQSRGLVVIPMTSARENGKEKFSKPSPTWVRVNTRGEIGYVLCEQIRYIDRGRCTGAERGHLPDYDMGQVDARLKQFLLT